MGNMFGFSVLPVQEHTLQAGRKGSEWQISIPGTVGFSVGPVLSPTLLTSPDLFYNAFYGNPKK